MTMKEDYWLVAFGLLLASAYCCLGYFLMKSGSRFGAYLFGARPDTLIGKLLRNWCGSQPRSWIHTGLQWLVVLVFFWIALKLFNFEPRLFYLWSLVLAFDLGVIMGLLERDDHFAQHQETLRRTCSLCGVFSVDANGQPNKRCPCCFNLWSEH